MTDIGTIRSVAEADLSVVSGRRILLRIDLGSHTVLQGLSHAEAQRLSEWLSEDQGEALAVGGVEARDEGNAGLVLMLDDVAVRLTGAQGGTLARMLHEAVSFGEGSE